MISRIVIHRQMLQDGAMKSTNFVAKLLRGSRRPRVVGELTMADVSDAYGPTVSFVSVDPEVQRQGVGTRLYEAAARDACEIYGAPLTSDAMRSAYSQKFWEKQVAKGRATCLKECSSHNPNCGPSAPVVGRGRCVRYRMIDCPAPLRLDGARGKRR